MIQQLIYKIHLLTFGEGRRSTDVFYFQNSDSESTGKDHFFLFFDYTDYRHLGKKDIKNIRDLIVSKIEEHKFFNLPNQETAPAFEKILRELNSLLLPLLPSGDPLHQSLSILISHIRSDAVSFGYAGNPEAFFIRPKVSGDGLMLQIFEKKDWRENQSASLFSNIVSGKISSGDIIFLATPNVLDYLSQEKIKRILLSLSPQPAAESLKTLLNEARQREKFGMIIIKAVASLPIKHEGSHHSIEEFIGKKSSTQSILTPNFLNLLSSAVDKTKGMARKIFSDVSDFIKQTAAKTASKNPPKTNVNSRPNSDQRPVTADAPSNLNNNKKMTMRDFFDYLKKMPVKQQRLLMIISALVMILIIGIFFSFNDRKTRQTASQNSALATQIRGYVENAEADLIYGNDASARTAFNQISSDLKTPEGENFLKNNENRDILNRYDIIKQKLFHLTPFSGKESTDIKLSFSPETAAVERIIPFGKRFVVLDSSGKFYSLDVDKKTQTIFTNQLGQKPTLISSSKQILAGLNDIKIDQYDSALKITSLKIDPLPARAVSSMNFFNDKLYLLVPNERQIYSYGRSGDAYKKTKTWIAEGGETIVDAIDFTIDGDMYVLKNNGAVVKFSKGKPVDFNLEPIEYRASMNKITTPSESAPLYILDKAAGRVIVYDKSGKLVAQYITDQAIIDIAANDSGQLALLYEKNVQIFKMK